MDIQDLRIFARLAALQNLSAVGQELGLTPGTISKRLQALEDYLSVRLFERTTRSIRITDEGAIFFEHVTRILSEVEQARASVGDKVTQPKGRIKLSAPASLGRVLIAPAICAFVENYPDIIVHVDISDRVMNLQEEGYDIAIRAGHLTDSSLKAKRLATDRQIIAASPDYFRRHPLPTTPAALLQHNCLVLGEAATWSFQHCGTAEPVRVSGRLKSDNAAFLHQAALEGAGIVRLSEARLGGDVRSGQLVRVLENYETGAESAVWAVYPNSRHLLPKLRVLLDFLADWCRDRREGNGSHKATVDGHTAEPDRHENWSQRAAAAGPSRIIAPLMP